MGIGASRTKQIVETMLENKIKSDISNTMVSTVEKINETVNSEIQNIITSTQTDAKADAVCIQNITISDVETGEGGSIDIHDVHTKSKLSVAQDVIQKALSNTKIEGKMKTELKEKVENNAAAQNAIESALKQVLDQITKMPASENPVSVLAPGIAVTDTEQKQKTEIRNSIETNIKNMIENKTIIKDILKNVVERNIKTENLVKCKTAADSLSFINLQRLKTGKKGKINISDIKSTCFIDLIANCMNVSETGQDFVNDIANKIDKDIQQKVEAKNNSSAKGESENKLIGEITGSTLSKLIQLGGLCVLVGGGIYIWSKYKNNSNNNK